MIAWFTALPVEQRGWVLLGVAGVAFGLLLAALIVVDVRYQAHRDRVERAGQQTVVLPAADCCLCPPGECPGQHVPWADIERLRLARPLTAADRADITEDHRFVRLADGDEDHL